MKIDKKTTEPPQCEDNLRNLEHCKEEAKGYLSHGVDDEFTKIAGLANLFSSMVEQNHPALTDQAHIDEERFIKTLSFPAYGNLAKDFIDCYKVPYHPKFNSLDRILILPEEDTTPARPALAFSEEKDKETEQWNHRESIDFATKVVEVDARTLDRRRKISQDGAGFAGGLSKPVYHGREIGEFTKKNLMVKGRIYQVCDHALGRTIFEMLPSLGSRKAAIVGVQLSEMSIGAILGVTGLALAPVSFGISKIVTDQINTVVTLSGEAIISGVKGAQPPKILMQSALRGVQLEIPAGKILNLAETGAQAVSMASIGSCILADAILKNMSTRYTSYIHPSQLGDSDVLFEMNQRIDYLSRFLIPYGQLLYRKARHIDNKKKLRNILAEQFTILRDLERKKTKALHFYQLALLAERVPETHREKIESDCEFACPDIRKNSHRTVLRCFKTLLQQADANHASDVVEAADAYSISTKSVNAS